MKVHADSAGEEPWYLVWLDGEIVPWALSADTEEGWVTYYHFDRIEGQAVLRVKKKSGKVSLERVVESGD